MSYLGNAWEFEKFNLKDMWGKIKDDPERLFIGAVTPWTSKMWGKILGKDYEPIVDQMGGPYGGSTISAFGNKDGGVYARAKESGVPTKEAGNLHDAAHVIAALYAGGYGLGALGGGGAAGGAAAPSAAGSTASSAAPSVAGFMPGTAAAPMEGITVYGSSGLGMGAGTEAAMAAAGAGGATAAGNQGFDWQRMLNQSMPTGGNQQQQMQSAAPARGARPGMWDRIKGGLGKMGDNLLQIDSRAAESMSPDQLAALKRNAFLNMGLGMMAASNRGAGFGEAAAFGLGQGQAGLTNALQRDYEMAREARREQRQKTRDEIEDRRYEEERAYRAEQDRIRQEMEREQMEESRRRFEESIALGRAGLGLRERQLDMTAGLGRAPEVRVTDRGIFERDPSTGQWNLVPGTEPTGVSGRPIPQGMANNLKINASVMNQIDQVLPQLRDESGNFTEKARNAFGARNAAIDALMSDAISDNAKNFFDEEGTDLRAIVTNLNSYVVKERNGAAVTVAEFARQRGFLPTDKDSVEVIEKKLMNLRKAIADEQQYLLDFVESQGYRPPPGQMGQGGWSIEEVP